MNTLVENGIKTLVEVCCFSSSTRADSDLGSFELSNRSRRAIHLRLILKRSTARDTSRKSWSLKFHFARVYNTFERIFIKFSTKNHVRGRVAFFFLFSFRYFRTTPRYSAPNKIIARNPTRYRWNNKTGVGICRFAYEGGSRERGAGEALATVFNR